MSRYKLISPQKWHYNPVATQVVIRWNYNYCSVETESWFDKVLRRITGQTQSTYQSVDTYKLHTRPTSCLGVIAYYWEIQYRYNSVQLIVIKYFNRTTPGEQRN